MKLKYMQLFFSLKPGFEQSLNHNNQKLYIVFIFEVIGGKCTAVNSALLQ